MDFSSGVMILAGVSVLWMVMRFGYGPKMGGASLASMFKREKAQPKPGMGAEALTTLLDDCRRMVAEDSALRGMILAGPFATRKGKADTLVTLIFLTKEVERYASKDWFARWPYIARGHLVMEHKAEQSAGMWLHHLTLRGAPPLLFAFLDHASAKPPSALRNALTQGAQALDTATPDAKAALARWRDEPASHQGD